MRILILGAAGLLGRKLAERLARDGGLGTSPVDHLALVDVVAPVAPPAGFTLSTAVADLSAPGIAERLAADRPDVVFHLAAIVSGEAEVDLELGYRVNLDGTRALLDALRSVGDGYRPRVVFTSSIAVFGAPFPATIGDDFHLTPLTSYGTQKAIGELLLCDFSRRGLIDGIALRLPTICVRPGAPNRAASGFFSSIIREPLVGREAVLPVAETVRHWHASPRAAIGFLVHAATLDTAAVGPRRALAMPGVSATVAEQLAALRAVGGDAALALVRREPDPLVARIVAGWAERIDARRAEALGFRAEADFAEIVRVHLEDELGGWPPARAT